MNQEVMIHLQTLFPLISTSQTAILTWTSPLIVFRVKSLWPGAFTNVIICFPTLLYPSLLPFPYLCYCQLRPNMWTKICQPFETAVHTYTQFFCLYDPEEANGPSVTSSTRPMATRLSSWYSSYTFSSSSVTNNSYVLQQHLFLFMLNLWLQYSYFLHSGT